MEVFLMLDFILLVIFKTVGKQNIQSRLIANVYTGKLKEITPQKMTY